jgi:hypothetical protein
MDILFYVSAGLGVTISVAIALFSLMRLRKLSIDEAFDGGFEHENRTRVTRVSGRYIIPDNNLFDDHKEKQK